MSQPASPPSTQRAPGPVSRLLNGEFRDPMKFGLLGTAAALIVLLLVLLVRLGWTDTPVRLWLGATATLFLFVGLWMVLETEGAAGKPADSTRLQLLILGGFLGLFTTLLAVAMPIWMYPEIFAGGLEVWRQNAGKVFLCAVLLVSGLALTFASAQLGRLAERTSPSLRRYIYWYNALLTGLLLLAILGLVNVLTYVQWGPFGLFGRRWDWTVTRIYSLSTATENFLKKLDKPVQVYVLLPGQTLVTQDTKRLLENFRSVSDKVTIQSVSRDLDPKALENLIEKYQVPDSYGLLVVYGNAPNEQSEFVRADDLLEAPKGPRQPKEEKIEYVYKGEAALMKALTLLTEEKKKAIVYFTQGNGEPAAGAGMPEGRFAQTISELRDRLTRANYEVKELTFAPGVDKVPDDAEVVVVMNPRLGLPDTANRALNAYMNPTGAGRKGKMIVLADVVLTPDRSKMAPLGLEPLLGQFNVRLGSERILAYKNNPTELVVMTNFRSRNPVAQAFQSGDSPKVFYFDDARTVSAGTPAAPGAREPYQVEPLVMTLPRMPVWKETNFGDPIGLIEGLSQDELRKKLSPQTLPVAVAVSEGDPSIPDDRAHRGVTSKESVPRMIVFGDSTWVTDQGSGPRVGKLHQDLFLSCLAWLRGRANIGTDSDDAGKSRKEFTLAGSVTPDRVQRMRWLPMALMMVAFIGLGGGIWLVRRR